MISDLAYFYQGGAPIESLEHRPILELFELKVRSDKISRKIKAEMNKP